LKAALHLTIVNMTIKAILVSDLFIFYADRDKDLS